MKLFFRTLRAILTPILLIGDKLFPPRKLPAAALNQSELAKAQQQLALYEFAACPFCIKVRRQTKRLRLDIERRNVLKNQAWHDELEQQGGKRKVPCLRIDSNDGSTEWLYESKQINEYLSQRLVA